MKQFRNALVPEQHNAVFSPRSNPPGNLLSWVCSRLKPSVNGKGIIAVVCCKRAATSGTPDDSTALMGTSRSRVFRSSNVPLLPMAAKRLSSRLSIHERYATCRPLLIAGVPLSGDHFQTLSPLAHTLYLNTFLFSLGSTPLANSLMASSRRPLASDQRNFRVFPQHQHLLLTAKTITKPPVFGAIR